MGEEVKITYETLYDLYRREKDRAELQELPDTFFADVATYLAEKQASLSPTQGSIFDTEAQKSRIQIDNVRKVLKALYDRRESKIINMAMIKARTQSIVNLQPLLDSEKDLYNSIVSILHMYRGGVLQNLISGNSVVNVAPPTHVQTPIVQPAPIIPSPAAPPAPEVVPTQPEATPAAIEVAQPAPQPEPSPAPVEAVPEPTPAAVPETPTPAEPATLAVTDDTNSLHLPQTIPKSVRFLCSVPKFVGPNLEVYGPFSKNDTATLPDPIVNVLLSKGRVEAQETSQNSI